MYPPKRQDRPSHLLFFRSPLSWTHQMLQDSFNGRDPKAASYEGDREQAKKEPLYLQKYRT